MKTIFRKDLEITPYPKAYVPPTLTDRIDAMGLTPNQTCCFNLSATWSQKMQGMFITVNPEDEQDDDKKDKLWELRAYVPNFFIN